MTISNDFFLVKEPVIPVYVKPEAGTEIETQAVYGTSLKIIESLGDLWKKIEAPDGSLGWVSSSSLTKNVLSTEGTSLPVKNFFAHVYKVNDTIPYLPLMTLPYGARVHLAGNADSGERWIPIRLVSGEDAWIQRGDLDFSPKLKTLADLPSFGKKFLGLPYTWGGISTYGFDCSGFMQFLFLQMGVFLPRNAREQINSPLLNPVEKQNLQVSDLVFFGENKITHVGLYLGDGEFLHAGVRDGAPMIMTSHLDTTKYTYREARRLKNG